MLADKIKFAFSFFFVLVIFMSCKKNSQNVQQDWYKSYYDTNEGRFIEYNVHEINHDENAIIQHDTLNYFLRIQIEDTISDNLGRVNRKYVRYKKMNSNDPWQISDVWMTIKSVTVVTDKQHVVSLCPEEGPTNFVDV